MDKTPQETQNLPHSGNLPDSLREAPVRDFDKTSLHEANENKLLVTPDSAADLIGNNPNKKSRKGLMIGVGAAGLAIAAGAVFGINAANQAPEQAAPAPAAPAEPGEPAEPNGEVAEQPAQNGLEVAGLPTVSELEVSSELPDAEVAEGFVSLFSEWGMAGANEEMRDLSYEGDYPNLSLSEYGELVAETSAPVFAAAAYGDYINDPAIQESISEQIDYNAVIIQGHIQTYGQQSDETFYQYVNFVSLDSVTENADGTVTYVSTVEQDSNRSQNIIEGDNDGYLMNATFTVDKSTPIAHLAKAAEFTPKQ